MILILIMTLKTGRSGALILVAIQLKINILDLNSRIFNRIEEGFRSILYQKSDLNLNLKMGFLFTVSKVVIPIAMVSTICLWIATTALITKKISWTDEYSMRELLFSLEANQLAEDQRDKLISNAIGMEILHLMVHMLPFIVMLIGIWCDHFYTIHTTASFSLISMIYDDFDVVNRWHQLWNSDENRAQNTIYVLSHFLHIFCVLASILFSHFILKPYPRKVEDKH